MVRIVQIRDAFGRYVSSGVTSVLPVWEDGGRGTPDVTLDVINEGTYGQWRVTVADPETPRGHAIILLSYGDGTGGTAVEQVRVEDRRVASI